MKKLLAILLTLIFAFSCFSALGTTAMAEDAVSVVGEKVNSNSDFATEEGRAKWAVRNTTADFAQEDDSWYATIKSSASKNALLYTPTFVIWSGATYEISYYVRVSDGSATFPAEKAPSAGVAVTNKTSSEDVKYPDSETSDYSIDSQMYAHNGINQAVRGNFEGHWYYDDALYYKGKNYSDLYQKDFLSKASGYGSDANTIFNGWKKMVFRFTATGSNVMGAMAFYLSPYADTAEENYLAFDVKDIVVKQTSDSAPSGAILTSDFDGIDNIKESRWHMFVKAADQPNYDSALANILLEEADGSGFVRINSQNKSVEGSVTQKSALRSSTFTLVPGNKYRICYQIRVPEQENDFLNFTLSGTQYAIAPGFTLYQHDTNLTQAGYVSSEGPTSDYSRVSSSATYSDNDTDNVRRTDITYYWTVNGKTVTKTLYSISEGVPKYNTVTNVTNRSPLYAATVDADGNLVSPNEAFADWTDISVEFTAKEESTEEYGTPQVVQMEFFLPEGISSGYYFDIKDIVVYEEEATADPELTDDIVFYQSFEDVDTVTTEVQVYQGGMVDGMFVAGKPSWDVKAAIINEYAGNGRKYLSLGAATNQQVYIPFDDGALQVFDKENNNKYYDFSFKWKTSVENQIVNIKLVGFDGEITDETRFGNYYTAIATADLSWLDSSSLNGTDNWRTVKFKKLLNSDLNFEHYGIVLVYKGSDAFALDSFLVEQKTMVPGDYDLSGKTEAKDTTLLAQYFAGWESSLDVQLADVNNDTKTNLFDLVYHAQTVAGWFDEPAE